jgi:hypothetical protein
VNTGGRMRKRHKSGGALISTQAKQAEEAHVSRRLGWSRPW